MMNSDVRRRACQLRIDGRYGCEFLIVAIVRQAVLDGDWHYIEEFGIHLCESIGIDPSLFRQKIEEKRGRAM